MFITLIKTLIALRSGFVPDASYPTDYSTNLNNGDEFDFIVVGGGSAGSVLANRLSRISNWNILLLEAGGYPSEISEIPALTFSLQDTEDDWQYRMEPSKTCCLGVRNNECKCPRGKGLGGSSTINLMMYTRSTRYDHERWTKKGNNGWDYDSIVKYYKNLEHVHIENNNPYGTDGELHLTCRKSNQPIRDGLEKAYQELGYYEYTEDQPIGYRDLLQTIYEGTRQNAAKAFLIPVKERKNLHVAINSRVTKVLIDPKSLTASGVEVRIQNNLLKLMAKKEVIISAGTIDSPRILMHSGIGPKDHLSEIGIDTVKDLKVGDNYQDHIGYPFLAVGVDNSAVASLTSIQLVNELYQFFIHRQGALSNLDLTSFGSYINTQNQTKFANVQYVHAVVPPQDPYIAQEVLRATAAPVELSKTLTEFNQNMSILIFLPIVLNPKSSGHVRLRNSNPLSNPVIIPNHLSDPNGNDIEVFVDAIKFITNLISTKALKSFTPKILNLDIKNCRGIQQNSDDYWRCAVRNIAIPLYHPVGTCKMGEEKDPSAVVDSQLKVHGVKRLRVIDASIMPVIPSCNTNAPTLMIGEKGADLLIQKWLNIHDEL